MNDRPRAIDGVIDEAGNVTVCRGGPTADCGDESWHSSHVMSGHVHDDDSSETGNCSTCGASGLPTWNGPDDPRP